MINLTLFDDSNKFQYNWDLIEDTSKREKVRTSVQQYQQTFETNRRAAEQLIEQDTIAKAKCVFEVKEELSHGQFQDVCQTALGLNKDTAAAYLSIHKNYLNGATSEDVIAMVRHMEPRAAQQLLKADESVQQQHVEKYQQTGSVPSRRAFTQQQQQWIDRQQQQKRMDEAIERKYQEAFADSPASPFYDPSLNPQDQTEQETVLSPGVSVFHDDKPTSNPYHGKTRWDLLSEVVDTLNLVVNMPDDGNKYTPSTIRIAANTCRQILERLDQIAAVSN